MLKVQCQEADLLTELNAIEEDQVAKEYVEEEVDAVGVEDVQEEGIGNADIDVDEVKVPCVCQEVDFDVEHPRNMNILNSLKKVKETEESENGKELTYTLIEDFNIVEEENEILAD